MAPARSKLVIPRPCKLALRCCHARHTCPPFATHPNPPSPESMQMYYLTTATTAVVAVAYLVMATGSQISRPYGDSFDFTWVRRGRAARRQPRYGARRTALARRQCESAGALDGQHAPCDHALLSSPHLPRPQVRYLEWLGVTPILLTQFGILGGMPWSEIYFMNFWNVVMLAAGYGAQTAATVSGIWPLFTMGCAAQAIVFYQLASRWKRSYGFVCEDNLFASLFKLMFGTWNLITGARVCGRSDAMTRVCGGAALYPRSPAPPPPSHQ